MCILGFIYIPVFQCIKGSKTSGIILSLLFMVYVKELIVLLKYSGFGYHVGTESIGALEYTDDHTLMSPNLKRSQSHVMYLYKLYYAI